MAEGRSGIGLDICYPLRFAIIVCVIILKQSMFICIGCFCNNIMAMDDHFLRKRGRIFFTINTKTATIANNSFILSELFFTGFGIG